jgi:hypothetical protein
MRMGRTLMAAAGAAAAAAWGLLAMGSAGAIPVQSFDTTAGAVKITPVYHASVLIVAGGKNIDIDPTKPGDFSSMPKADLILITDIHGDHMDPATIASLSKSGAPAGIRCTPGARRPPAKNSRERTCATQNLAIIMV